MLECVSMSLAGAAGGLLYVFFTDAVTKGIRGPTAVEIKQGVLQWIVGTCRTMAIGAAGGFLVWASGGTRDFASRTADPVRIGIALIAGAGGPKYVRSLIDKGETQNTNGALSAAVDSLTTKMAAVGQSNLGERLEDIKNLNRQVADEQDPKAALELARKLRDVAGSL